ncbi:EutN/CcmL family microcompartment protein [Tindallia californiensis]|uniref:Ethanolamine utilization protein EutN n=1 Tax=Tindallia californiensis TaxID=159292 RepID=A0A1H3LT52_9FIRM|nr:EutN/CcmL family microcompartment protein [Tindallia californiensis]SDY67148.1 ethanolamine utilization protein EutN [Tindallia californiensis]
MIIGKVIGNVWATKKETSLNGLKLLVVQVVENQIEISDREDSDLPKKKSRRMVAADAVGAGIGDDVLVVSGSSARRAIEGDGKAVDATIVGIIDACEIVEECS